MPYFFLLLLLFFLSACQTKTYRGPVSDHFDGQHFFYPGEQGRKESSATDLLNLWMSVIQHPWSRRLPTIPYAILPNHLSNTLVTFINHSTVLVQMPQTNFLFDPIYSKRASPFQWIGPKRVRNPSIPFDRLPHIDAVLISHNHYDHMDLATLRALEKAYHPIFIVPLGNKKALQAYFTHVIELDWWQQTRIKHVDVTLLPARHSTRRGLFDYNKTLWGSYGLKAKGKSFYFAGDTGYAPHFKAIQARWGKPDFAFIPIGAYQPRALLKHDHMDPMEAVRAHLDLGSHMSMGIHWGTFQLSAESIDQPIKDLAQARQYHHVPEAAFFIIQEGMPFYVPH